MYGATQPNGLTKNKQQKKAEKIREAEDVRDGLSEALRGLGIVLPSLDVEALAYGDKNPNPLLDLGRCNLQVARRLTAALLTEKGERKS